MGDVKTASSAIEIVRKRKDGADHAIEDILGSLDRQNSLPPSRKISEIESPTRQRNFR